MLPPGFSDLLLAKEMQLESNMSSELVNEIASLYAIAIEYYEHVKDARYLDF
jgi:hypothetical protein